MQVLVRPSFPHQYSLNQSVPISREWGIWLIYSGSLVMEYSGYTADLNNNPVGEKNPVPVAIWRLIFSKLV
jgi:hypothetical protein